MWKFPAGDKESGNNIEGLWTLCLLRVSLHSHSCSKLHLPHTDPVVVTCPVGRLSTSSPWPSSAGSLAIIPLTGSCRGPACGPAQGIPIRKCLPDPQPGQQKASVAGHPRREVPGSAPNELAALLLAICHNFLLGILPTSYRVAREIPEPRFGEAESCLWRPLPRAEAEGTAAHEGVIKPAVTQKASTEGDKRKAWARPREWIIISF